MVTGSRKYILTNKHKKRAMPNPTNTTSEPANKLTWDAVTDTVQILQEF